MFDALSSCRLVAIMTLGLSAAVFAEAPGPSMGDASAGKTKSAVCAACHGADGNSVTPEWPKIAGQHSKYLQDQLHNFRAGLRKNELMSPMAANLSDQDLADLAAYFASQTPRIGQADPATVSAGEKLYRGGRADSGLPACMACHAPNGAGNPGAGYPSLRGQHAAYTAKQLNDYREGKRGGAQAAIMKTIAERMTPEEIAAVANYLQGLY